MVNVSLQIANKLGNIKKKLKYKQGIFSFFWEIRISGFIALYCGM
jgi:hypothetical protein